MGAAPRLTAPVQEATESPEPPAQPARDYGAVSSLVRSFEAVVGDAPFEFESLQNYVTAADPTITADQIRNAIKVIRRGRNLLLHGRGRYSFTKATTGSNDEGGDDHNPPLEAEPIARKSTRLNTSQ